MGKRDKHESDSAELSRKTSTSDMKKKKKKVSGAEKTAKKTEKKAASKSKKELAAMGEEDIESIVEQIEREQKKRTKVTERNVDPPSRRLNFTMIPHPDKDELVLYGGEFYNGQTTMIYPELYFYNIAGDKWTLIKAPGAPPPRCAHQMCASSANKGQLWVFGGEYASPSESQFYHYRDLWVYHIGDKQWEKVQAAHGPSSRSGHRMVYLKKRLYVFGGFHDNLRDYKYFNDVHCFDTETRQWIALEVSGTAPEPRSGCVMLALSDGRIFVYGGYSKERIKKDVDKGRIFTDAFFLTPKKDDETGTKFKWVSTKIGGVRVTPRCGMPATLLKNNISYCFGGVFDVEENEENMESTFYNDLYSLDLEKMQWQQVKIYGKDKPKKEKEVKEPENVEEVEKELSSVMLSDDGVFKVTVAPVQTSAPKFATKANLPRLFWPSSRMNCGLALKGGSLFMFGGMYEDNKREITYSDFYSLDVKKLDVWKTLVEDELETMVWEGSDSSGSDTGSESEEDDGSE